MKVREKSRANPKNGCIKTVVKLVSSEILSKDSINSNKTCESVAIFCAATKKEKTGIRR